MKKILRNNTGGFAHLIGVILVSVIGTSMAIAMLSVNISILQSQDAAHALRQVMANAESCADMALLGLSEDPLYVGSETYDVGNIHCTSITSNSPSADGREFLIQTSGAFEEYVMNIEVAGTIASGTPPEISGWEKVADF